VDAGMADRMADCAGPCDQEAMITIAADRMICWRLSLQEVRDVAGLILDLSLLKAAA
jgi:hypothetical protein